MSQIPHSVPRPSRGMNPGRTGATVLLMILAAIVTASSLRPGATSIGPVLPELISALEMSGTTAGVLTALPGICFAVVGLLSNRLTTWTGIAGALVIATFVSTLGLVSRALTDSWVVFLLFSAIALSGMAIGNVVLPALIKKEFPRRAAQMATAYTTFLAVGATVPTFLTPVLATSGDARLGVGEGWRLAIGTWGSISLVAFALWLLLYIRDRQLRQKESPLPSAGRTGRPAVWRSRTAVALMFFFGLQSMQAYIQFGWAPAAYRAGGLDPTAAGLMLSIIALGGIPGGLLMPMLVARGRGLSGLIVLFGSLLAVGYLGIAFLPTTLPWLWAICLSISGFCFPTALTLIIEKTDDATTTAAVSGFVQPIGYLLAAVGPLLVGVIFGALGNWIPILLVLALTAIPMTLAGIIAVRGRNVDHELEAKTRLH